MLTTVGSGATGIAFWVTRAEISAHETNGFSLLDNEGETSERLEEASRIGRELQKYPELFAQNNKAASDAAILINERNYQLVENLHFAHEMLLYNLRGWYKTLWQNGIPCDFIEASQLADLDSDKCKTLIVPTMLSVSNKEAEELIRYVKNGGNLILEGACGRLDEAALAVRGQMNALLRNLLGIVVEMHSLVREPDDNYRWSQPEFSWGEYEEAGFLSGDGQLENIRLKANFYIETYKTDDKESICLRWNGKPAGIIKHCGKGKVFLIGTCLGPNSTAYVETESHSGINKLLGQCNVFPLHTGKLLVQKRIGKGNEAWFITNPTEETLTENFELPKGAKAFNLLDADSEILSGSDMFSITVNSLGIRVIIVKTDT
jgi:hypothetical protein